MSVQEALQSQTDRATRRFGRILANCCIAVWVQLLRQVQIKSALGVTQVEFRRDLWHQKTRVPDLSCGFVGVILYLAILVEHRLLTDTETDRQTDRHGAIAYTALAWRRAVKRLGLFGHSPL